MLQQLHDTAPADRFTLRWLMENLRHHAFGTLMLLLGVVAIAPGVCLLAALLLMVPSAQLMLGRPAPAFPRRIADRGLPTRRLAALVQRAVPVLRWLERMIRPRWPGLLAVARRPAGGVILVQSAVVVVMPIPFSNAVPAAAIVLIALALLEEDGLLLAIALGASSLVVAGAGALLWGTVAGAKWIGGG